MRSYLVYRKISLDEIEVLLYEVPKYNVLGIRGYFKRVCCTCLVFPPGFFESRRE